MPVDRSRQPASLAGAAGLSTFFPLRTLCAPKIPATVSSVPLNRLLFLGFMLPSGHEEAWPSNPRHGQLYQSARAIRRWGRGSPGTHFRMSGPSSFPSGHAQVYLGECSVIWGAFRHRYSHPPLWTPPMLQLSGAVGSDTGTQH